MPKEAFGGDDDSESPPEEKKKLSLDKFNLSPDLNIRDLFWSIMGSYAATKKPGVDLKGLEQDRFALMRIALSILTTQNTEHYGLSPRFVSMYSVMMMLDGGWDDALSQFLERAAEERSGLAPALSYALKRLMSNESYAGLLSEQLSMLVRDRGTSETGLRLVADIGSAELVRSLRKELMIIARGDIGENQLNAIKALSLIRDDESVKQAFIVILSHWDAQARLAAAQALSSLRDDKDVKAAAEKRLEMETDSKVKQALKRIAK